MCANIAYIQETLRYVYARGCIYGAKIAGIWLIYIAKKIFSQNPNLGILPANR